ncbi:hypothetical protein KP509_11G098400 [Ceratopteris richardii]|uniref:methionine adenosyltransferase n=1 Tax=Ceratopteris richardii TaxID=49495 RepID=A0A8T2U115_CERRI|nr:hypothetical protein KP509_11G098400 [Ceratopteris richardii]
MATFLFTSEFVNEIHPDKLCDQSKVACETCTKTNMVMIFGEITTKAVVDYEKVVRDTCREIGFVSDDVGLDADHCKVLRPEEVGAGDQGHMFGYATDETEELMPLSHVLTTKLGAKLTEVRKNGTCPWLRPDRKTQVTVEYKNEDGAMHDETVTNDKIASDLNEFVIKPVIPEKYLDEKPIFHLNPSGRFVIGGPHGDAGLTGRKIIIDTWWGSTKVDRSGAYIVQQAAKSVVAAGFARRCIVQVSYAIGVPEPLSVFVDTYETGMIAINLHLRRGGNKGYQKTAAYGHFGRDDPDFTWEIVKPLKAEKA